VTVLVAFCLAPHQDHHYEQNLVSKLYTTEPNDEDPLARQLDVARASEKANNDDSDYDQKGKDLINRLKTRVPVGMTFWDKLLTLVCCKYCCKRCIDEKRFEKRMIVEQARKLVDDEIDVFSLV